MASFKNLAITERKAIIAGILIKRSNGVLNKEEIKKIISDIDVLYQYKINVIHGDIKEFGKKIYDKIYHYNGLEIAKTKNKIILGDIKIGRVVVDKLSVPPRLIHIEMPNFDIHTTQAVELNVIDPANPYQKELHIYVPNKPHYDMDHDILVLHKILGLKNLEL